jgi:hypothetical protein
MQTGDRWMVKRRLCRSTLSPAQVASKTNEVERAAPKQLIVSDNRLEAPARRRWKRADAEDAAEAVPGFD